MLRNRNTASFNRTIKELKLLNHYIPYTPRLSFNRTIKELKRIFSDEINFHYAAFNRTIKELKQSKQANATAHVDF